MRVIVIASSDIKDIFSICGAIARSGWKPDHVITNAPENIGAKWAKMCNVPLTITPDPLNSACAVLVILNTPNVPEIVMEAKRRGHSIYIHRV